MAIYREENHNNTRNLSPLESMDGDLEQGRLRSGVASKQLFDLDWKPGDGTELVDAELQLKIRKQTYHEANEPSVVDFRCLFGKFSPDKNWSKTFSIFDVRPGDVSFSVSFSTYPVRLGIQQYLMEDIKGAVKTGSFDESFPNLKVLSTDLETLPLDKLERVISKQAARQQPVISPIGIPIPLNSIHTFGFVLVIAIWLYFWIYVSSKRYLWDLFTIKIGIKECISHFRSING